MPLAHVRAGSLSGGITAQGLDCASAGEFILNLAQLGVALFKLNFTSKTIKKSQINKKIRVWLLGLKPWSLRLQHSNITTR